MAVASSPSRRNLKRWGILAGLMVLAAAAVVLRFGGPGYGSDETASSGGAPPPSVQVAAGPGSFTIGGTLRPGVNRITFQNAAQEPRNAQLVRLAPGFTPRQLLDAIAAGGRWPEWARHAGGPGLTAPGRSMSAEVELERAQYVLLAMPPGHGGALRVQPGVVAAFEATGEPTGAAPTSPTITVRARRSELQAPARHRVGDVRLLLVNEDDTPHDVSVFAFREGGTVEDLIAWLSTGRGEAPGVFAGGVQAVEPGERALAVLFLTAGRYALVSMFPEPDGVTPAFHRGLVRELTVE